MPRILLGVTVAMTAQAFLIDQMVTMVKRGWDVHLACSPDDGTDAFVVLGDIDGITLHPLSMARRPSPIQDLKSFIAWLRLIRRVRPDLVIASTPKAGFIGMVAARLLRVPRRIYHVRGLRAEGLRWPLSAVSRASERSATAAASAVLIDSSSLRVAMERKELLPRGKGTVLGLGSCCGIDTERFRLPSKAERLAARRLFGFEVEEVVIGFVGRLAVDKGVGELVESARILHEEDSRVRLLMVGPHEELQGLREILPQTCASDWRSAPGRVEDPLEAYWAFDIFCLPSYREGFPIAALEAQACGLPVVTTTATGCSDSILDGRTGLSVPARSSTDLTRALRTLTENAALRMQMGAAANEWVHFHFNRNLVNERVVDFFGSVMESSSGGFETSA